MTKKSIAIILFSVIVLLLAVLGYFLIPTDKSNTDTIENSDGVQRLHVEDCKLADENGSTVQLTGMSSHGMLWYPEYANASAMETLKAYGANTFRIALYSDDDGGGYVQKPLETMQLAYTAIENAISTDLYVIVDWHILQDGNPLTNLESALAFFEEIASHYGDCPNILYEICNEPNSGASWDDIYAYAEAVIPVIRTYAPNAIIIVGTPEYCQSFDPVFQKPLPFENVMYSFHFYAGMHGEHYNELFNRCDKENIPVFVSEWGVHYGITGKAALSQAETFVTVLNRRGISWTAWSLCNKDEIFSAIRSDCAKLSGWELEDLTDVGQLFFKAFQS